MTGVSNIQLASDFGSSAEILLPNYEWALAVTQLQGALMYILTTPA